MGNKQQIEGNGQVRNSESYELKLAGMREQLMKVDKRELVEAILKMSNIMNTLVKEKKIISIPISLFRHVQLSAFELIVTYLRNNLNLRLSEIANLTARNPQAVYITLRNAKSKFQQDLVVQYSEYDIPLQIIADRNYSILETIVAYLVEKKGLSLAEISKLLYRDNRTIWTIYDRYKKKRGRL